MARGRPAVAPSCTDRAALSLGPPLSPLPRVRICVVSNSVGLRIRPPRLRPEDLTYAEILMRKGHHVRVRARAGSMVNEAFANWDDDVIAFFPDLVVLHYGVVEICPRRELRWLSHNSVANYFNNAVLGRAYVFPTASAKLKAKLSWFGNAVIRNCAKLVGAQWQWLPSQRFQEVVEASLRLTLKETATRVLVVGLSPCSDRVRKLLPGAHQAIAEANARLRELCAGFPSRVGFLDVTPLIPAEAVTELVPDGVHFSAIGHRLVAEAMERWLDQPGMAAPAVA